MIGGIDDDDNDNDNNTVHDDIVYVYAFNFNIQMDNRYRQGTVHRIDTTVCEYACVSMYNV